jgi:poly(3-hydroxybutyrate) depolymerase
VLHLHGTADENHPIGGGEGPKSIANVAFRSAAYSVETLAAAMACAEQPTESVDPADRDRAITAWTHCNGGVEVRLVAVAGAPHKWMADASAAILEFLLNHPRG